MSALYLYAITRSVSVPPPGPGLDDAPLELLPAGGLQAVVSRHPQTPSDASVEHVVRHNDVVESLNDAEVLPARFGSAFVDETQLLTLLEQRRPSVERALGRVGGRVEFSVHLLTETRDAPADRPVGGAFLRARAEIVRQAEKSRRLLDRLEGLAVDSRFRYARSPRILLSATYLVDRARAATFTAVAREISACAPEDLDVVCTGPWAPYSFAGLEEGSRVL